MFEPQPIEMVGTIVLVLLIVLICRAGLNQQPAVFVPDAADNSWMTHSSALTAIATSLALALLVFVVLRLLPLLWPRSVAAKTGRIAKVRRQLHPRSPEDCPQCVA